MLPKVLYSMLIGGLCALFYSIIFYGIPTLIRFIAKKSKKNKDEEEKEDDKIKEQKTREEKKNKAKSIFASNRIAVAISLLLCITLYLLFLTTAFTNERDTFICYTTKTGECYHSAVCQYATKSAYETTVYEACRDYRPCSHCNPCIERYKTTITERNYIAPFFISVPISIAFFYLLTYRKKEE